MSVYRLWSANLILHGAIWLGSLGFSTLFLFHSADAWFAMARENFLGTFVGIQISMAPEYLGIATAIALWSWPILELWNRRRPSPRWVRRWLVLAAWFWLTAFSASLFSSFSSWFAPLNFVREQTGIGLTYGNIAFLSLPVWTNAVVFGLVSIAAGGWGLSRAARRWWGLSGRLKGSTVAAGGLLAGTVAFFSAPERDVPAPDKPRKIDGPNIVMIGSDSLRADRLGCYGYSRDTSPAIDEIARQGVVCERVYVPSPSTLESLVALLYGRTPRAVGVRTIFPTREAIEQARRFPSLPQLLSDAGYRTVVAGDWAASNFDLLFPGFDARDVEPAQKFTDYIHAAATACHVFRLAFLTTPATSWVAPGISGVLRSRHDPDGILARAEREIESAARANRPLFMVIFLSTTHMPYTVPGNEPLTFGDPNYSGRHHRQIDFSVGELVHGDVGVSLYPERQRVIDLYDSCVRIFDRQVSRIAQALEKNKIDKNTLLVVYSDHGDDHWEPGTSFGRGVHAGDQSIRIPLVLRWPDRLKPRRVPELLRVMDFAPTAADLSGLAWPPGEGESARRHLEGEAVPDDREAFIESGIKWAAQMAYPPGGEHLTYPPITELVVPDREWESRLVITPETLAKVSRCEDRALVRGHRKLVYRPFGRGPEVTMYDLSADPHCRKPAAPDPELLKRLRAHIEGDPPEWYLAWERSAYESAWGR